MKNKNWSLKISLIAFAIGLFGLSFTSAAINFKLNVEGLENSFLEDVVLENMMYVHFADNGNDFGGFIYFSNGSGDYNNNILNYDENGLYEVKAGNVVYKCGVEMKGFYYNAQRGERLWPLDGETRGRWGLDDSSLPMTGGIYTICARDGYKEALSGCENGLDDYETCKENVRKEFLSDGNGYYGSLDQIYSGQSFNLTVGVEYDTSANDFISMSGYNNNPILSPTFVRINNNYQVGFIYDSNGGLGLAGCKFDGSFTGGSMKNLYKEIMSGSNKFLDVFTVGQTGIVYGGNVGNISCDAISTQDNLVKILVEGILGMDDAGSYTKFGGIGNSSDTKMQYFGTKSVSNAALMNYVAKEAEVLCRGKWKNSPNSNDNVWCSDGSVGDVQAKPGQTLIVKNGNVKISAMDNNDDYYDIFILSGNLIIDETNANIYLIGKDGFPKNEADQNVFNLYAFSGAGGNVEDIDCTEEPKPPICSFLDDQVTLSQINDVKNLGDISTVASIIKGNFIVNGSVIGTGDNENDGNLRNKYFIYGKFTTRDSISQLEKVFSWRCNNQVGTNGYLCPTFDGKDYYQSAALVVIDQNYNSPLL